jgi:hypothetical protein
MTKKVDADAMAMIQKKAPAVFQMIEQCKKAKANAMFTLDAFEQNRATDEGEPALIYNVLRYARQEGVSIIIVPEPPQAPSPIVKP